ncbi:MAG: hypothetical protein IT377_02845 [Polyangiaceae bacterium]|nr:hypothetical protein [Polyangiaceae bacterium]
MLPSAIRFLEFHDAVVRSLVLNADGALAIEFSHMCVYFEREPELYSVQSYETRLEATGVSSITLDGPWCREDYVSAVAIDAKPIDKPMAVKLMDGIGPASLRLRFGSGLELEVGGQAFSMRLLRAGRALKDWRGPL